MGNYSSFIDKVDSMKENKDLGYKHIFTVNHQLRCTDFLVFPLPFERQDFPTITLDDEDLEYLYNKYYPLAAAERIKDEEYLKKKKENKIKELERELKELKDGQLAG